MFGCSFSFIHFITKDSQRATFMFPLVALHIISIIIFRVDFVHPTYYRMENMWKMLKSVWLCFNMIFKHMCPPLAGHAHRPASQNSASDFTLLCMIWLLECFILLPFQAVYNAALQTHTVVIVAAPSCEDGYGLAADVCGEACSLLQSI